jgi:hypothetical protein
MKNFLYKDGLYKDTIFYVKYSLLYFLNILAYL